MERQTAIELLQDVESSADLESISKRIEDKNNEDLEKICSVRIDGRTVFHAIAAKDRADILGQMLKKGVRINAVDKTALLVAVSQNAVQTTKLLLQNGASINVRSDDGKTPLHTAAELGYTNLLRLLLFFAKPKYINETEASGCTPLSLACMTGHVDTASFLINNGGLINFTTGFPPLHAAALMGYLDLVHLLLEKGARIDLKDKSGDTALHYAAFKGHKKIVEYLLERGSNVQWKDARGKTPVELAKVEEVREILLKAAGS